MKKSSFLFVGGIALSAITLSGCVSTVKTVATAPFKVAGKAVDWTTTSRDEADRNRGRKDRKEEKRAAKEQREREKQDRRAQNGNLG